jgi:type I restriction enzyme, S subunit
MNAEILLKHFDRIADVPDAVPRLRQFILDLAVRGKLLPQDPNDEPATDLLKRIAVEKERVAKKVGAKKQEDSSPSTAEHDSLELPPGWCMAHLQEICTSVTDGDHLPPPKAEEGIPFLVIGNVRNQVINFADCRHVSEQYYTELDPIRRPIVGDVLYTLVGSYGIPVLVRNSRPFCVQRHIGILRPSILMHVDFLVRILESQFVFNQATLCATGIAQKTVPLSGLRKIHIPLPPLAEQHRIVAKVDELLALCDQVAAAKAERETRRDRLAAATLHRLNNAVDVGAFRDHAHFALTHLSHLTSRPEQIIQLRQTILNLAVRGQLVPQDPKDEPGAELHEKLTASLEELQRLDGTRRRKEVEESRMFFTGDVFPKSWVLTSFDAVNAIVSGVAKGKDLRGCKTETYPYLRVANVQRGYLDLSLIKEIEIKVGEINRYRLERGDVLMTEGGDWDKLGRAAIWNEEINDCIHQNHIYRIRPADKTALLPQWITLFANSPLGRSYFEDASKQTTNLASINMTQLRSCPLPLPSTEEQHRIVTKVDELMALCDRLEVQLTTSQTESRRLLEATLHAALAGGG